MADVTTPVGVAPVSTAANPMTNAMEDHFQSLFDAGLDEPRASKPNPAEIAQAAEPEPTEVEALGGKETPEVEEGPEYDSVDAFLASQKIDPQSFQSLAVTVKIDGETKQVALADVIKSYQLEGHVNNKSIELSNQQKQFEQERDAAINLYRQQLTQAKTLGDLAQAQLMGEFNQVNWSQLRQTDPVQWTVLQQDFNNRAAAINQHLQQVAQAQTMQEQQLREQQAALLPRERERMLEKIPEWKDQAKFDSDRKAMTNYAKSVYQFSDAEISAITDHRYMHVLHDAAQFRALQASNPETLKRVRAAPQMARPGTRTQRDPKTVAKQQAIERFNKNPRDADAQAAMFEALL